MLDVVKEYAARRLVEAGESEEIARRHALHYLEMAEEAEPHLVRAGHEAWFGRLHVKRGNVRSGMGWAIGRGETVLALRYTVALWRYWRQLGEFAEGRRWSDAALAMSGTANASLRAKALWAASALAFPQGDHARMDALASEGLELVRQSEDPMDRRNALTIKGMVAMLQGRYADALEPFRESVTICRQLGLSWQLGTSCLNLGITQLHSGSGDALATLREGLRVYRELGDDIFAARINNTMAHAALARNDIAVADRLGREALFTAAQQGERQGIADGLHTLAAVAAARPTRTGPPPSPVPRQPSGRPSPHVPDRLTLRFRDAYCGRWRGPSRPSAGIDHGTLVMRWIPKPRLKMLSPVPRPVSNSRGALRRHPEPSPRPPGR